MITLSQVQKAVSKYVSSYRRLDLPSLTLSGVYALFPEEHKRLPAEVSAQWPEEWPQAKGQGVYIILDSKLHLLYVGKASMNNNLGSRLSAYFAYTRNGTSRCRIIDESWETKPEFVMTIAVPEGMGFEAAALEEFLINELQPPENTQGLL